MEVLVCHNEACPDWDYCLISHCHKDKLLMKICPEADLLVEFYKPEDTKRLFDDYGTEQEKYSIY